LGREWIVEGNKQSKNKQLESRTRTGPAPLSETEEEPCPDWDR